MHITIHEAIRDFDRFDAVIDVRSPDEWAADRLPGAINLPVLSNQERADIGRLYAGSSFAAKKLGAAWVARNIATALE
ncbi:MAG: rhodanese-like domain-containing protein, partial [Betaproteobacteria bacterium]